MLLRNNKKGTHFHILTPALDFGDAVSNDALGMRNALREAGFWAEIYAEHINAERLEEAKPLSQYARDGARNHQDCLIYHHSFYWEAGEKLYRDTANKRILKYHNITPAEFFAPYSNLYATWSNDGRAQTNRLVSEGAELFLGDSAFNTGELTQAGATPGRSFSVAPFHHAEELMLTPADLARLEKYLDGRINIVFVGRFAPNKGHLNLLRAFALFHHSAEPHSRLILVGKHNPEFQRYSEQIEMAVRDQGLEDSVEILSAASDNDLKTVYLTAHLFLCLSEHEGFCVPLLEAMLHKIPIVALECAAVPETLGACGLTVATMDDGLIVDLMETCVRDDSVQAHLARIGHERYIEHFSRNKIESEFLALIRGLVC
jgi:glycosyltransferase involved in cell wall biosynthesis